MAQVARVTPEKVSSAVIVEVTGIQVRAAKLKVKRSAASGKTVSPSLRAVANARRAAANAITPSPKG